MESWRVKVDVWKFQFPNILHAFSSLAVSFYVSSVVPFHGSIL